MHNSKTVFLVLALLTWGASCGVLVSALFTTTPVDKVTFLWLRFTTWSMMTFICVAFGLWRAIKEPDIKK